MITSGVTSSWRDGIGEQDTWKLDGLMKSKTQRIKQVSRAAGKEGEEGTAGDAERASSLHSMPECQLAATCCWLCVGCEYNRGDEPLGEELSDKSLMNENMR